jgi:hypothetical protein
MDPRKPGKYTYDGLDICFLWEPFYIGKGKGDRIKKHIMSHELFNQKRVNHNKIKNFKMKSIIDSGLNPFYIKLYTNLDNKKSSDIEIELILNIHKYTISQSLNDDKYKSAGGYMFRSYKLDKINPLIKKVVSVIQCDLQGNVIKEWDSMQIAAKTLNLSISGISLCCSGKYKSCGGFTWRYNK